MTSPDKEQQESVVKKVFYGILTFMFFTYFSIASCIFVPYHNWKYAQKEGFINWVVFGEFVATWKGLMWPFYLPNRRNPSEIALNQSVMRLNEALAIGSPPEMYFKLHTDEGKEYVELLKEAYQKALIVEAARLEKMPEIDGSFEVEYLSGLRMLVDGLEQRNGQMSLDGMVLLDRFTERYNAMPRLGSREE